MDTDLLSRAARAEVVKKPRRARLLMGGAALALLGVVVALAYRRWQTFDALSVHKAAERGDVGALRAALQRHPDQIDATGSFKLDKRLTMIPPIMWAVRGGNPEAVDLLIAHGADVNAADKFGMTALWLAVDENKPLLVETLLRANADPNAPTTFGSSPLICALRRGDVAMAKVLLDAGADPNAPVLKGTPLFRAVDAGQVESVRLLVDRGAKISNAKERAMILDVANRLPEEKAAAINNILSKQLQ